MTTDTKKTKLRHQLHCFATSTAIGGMERLLASLVRHSSQYGFEISVRLADVAGVEAVIAWFQQNGVAACTESAVPSAHSPQGIQTMRAFHSLLLRLPAGIVNIHYGVAHISLKEVLTVRLAGRKCVATVHAATPWSESGERARASTRRAALLCDAVIVHSQAVRRHLLEAGIPQSKIHTVPVGIAVPLSSPTREVARRHWNIPDAAFVVAAVARLVPETGIDDLVTAIAALPDGPEGVRLLIAGDGPAREELERLAARLMPGRVQFTGQLSDVNPVYAAADVFALPSHMEGLGLVFLEAAHHKLPSVGTRVGGIPEAVLEGKTGLLTSEGDAQALSQTLAQLRFDLDLRSRMGMAAQRRVREEFSEEIMTETYLRLLKHR